MLSGKKVNVEVTRGLDGRHAVESIKDVRAGGHRAVDVETKSRRLRAVDLGVVPGRGQCDAGRAGQGLNRRDEAVDSLSRGGIRGGDRAGDGQSVLGPILRVRQARLRRSDRVTPSELLSAAEVVCGITKFAACSR